MKRVQKSQTLHLKRETVRRLDCLELVHVVGGEEAVLQDTKDINCPWTRVLPVTGNG